FQAEDGIRDFHVTGVQTCALPIYAVKERDKGISYMFAVIDKKTDTIVGCTSFLDISFPHKRLEIGATWYNPTVWRSAINTNCKRSEERRVGKESKSRRSPGRWRQK